VKESYKTQRFINVPLIKSVICFHKLTLTSITRALVVKAYAANLNLIELFHYYWITFDR